VGNTRRDLGRGRHQQETTGNKSAFALAVAVGPTLRSERVNGHPGEYEANTMRASSEDISSTPRTGQGLTAQEAADILRVKVSTLAKWRQLGVGPPYSDPLGRDPRYHPRDLDEFLWGEGVVRNSSEAKQRRRKRVARKS
jgi:hypothetical protein